MKRDSGPDWDQAVEVGKLIRNVRRKHRLYIHSSKLPLAEAVDIPEDHGGTQMELQTSSPATPACASINHLNLIRRKQP